MVDGDLLEDILSTVLAIAPPKRGETLQVTHGWNLEPLELSRGTFHPRTINWQGFHVLRDVGLSGHQHKGQQYAIQDMLWGLREHSVEILTWALPLALSTMSFRTLLMSVSCAMTEMQIVVVCPDAQVAK